MNPSYQRIIAKLTEANGLFVSGQELAATVGIPLPVLNSWMPTIRAKHPHLVIEGARGKGYRIAGTRLAPLGYIDHTTAPPLPPRGDDEGRIRSRPGPKPGAGHQIGLVPLHHRMAANMAILDLLPAKTAEMVKTVALEAGEDVDAVLHRLISYGVEVHVDLVAMGENPICLKRQGIGSKTDQVWQ